jgi:hypothetical protein
LGTNVFRNGAKQAIAIETFHPVETFIRIGIISRDAISCPAKSSSKALH